jgi:retron-type reverse transcriptase
VRDRVVQMAAKLMLEPIFEADFQECSFGFRPKRSAKQALERIRKACNRKGNWVVDVDIQGYFDNRVFYTTQQWLCAKAEKHIREVVKERLAPPKMRHVTFQEYVDWLNLRIQGWKNYYATPYSAK